VDAFDALHASAKTATPGALAGAIKGTVGVVLDVGNDLATYAKKINPEQIFGQAAFILNNAPVILVGVGLLYLFGPRIAAALTTSRRKSA
jgi:hypothetical protein